MDMALKKIYYIYHNGAMMRLFGKAVAFVILVALTCTACHQRSRAFKVSPSVKDSVPYDSLEK